VCDNTKITDVFHVQSAKIHYFKENSTFSFLDKVVEKGY
jgi:hypothetical protein